MAWTGLTRLALSVEPRQHQRPNRRELLRTGNPLTAASVIEETLFTFDCPMWLSRSESTIDFRGPFGEPL